MGACSSTTERDAGFLFRNNFEFTRDLADWSLAKKVRFVYASSAATYGDGSAGMDDDDSKLDTLRPLNMYGYSKHLFDLHAKRAGFLDNIVGLKYFNVFGPNEDHKADMRSLVHKSFSQVQNEGRHPPVQELPEGFPRRRTEARFSLRQGRRGDDAASGRDPKGRRPFQHRLRRGADVD
jgi:nucleoside-diphosphate-sugar epimerase